MFFGHPNVASQLRFPFQESAFIIRVEVKSSMFFVSISRLCMSFKLNEGLFLVMMRCTFDDINSSHEQKYHHPLPANTTGNSWPPLLKGRQLWYVMVFTWRNGDRKNGTFFLANNMIKSICLELCISQVMVIFMIRDKSKSLAHFPVNVCLP